MANNNDIKETLKKYFYSGVGLASHAADAMQKSVNEMIKNGKMSEAEGRRLVASAVKKVEENRPGIEAKYNKAVHDFVKMTSAEVGKLQKKVMQMEKQLKTKTTAAPKPKKAKAPARKKS
ncbi:MAG: hypothetical protein IPP77_11145 [Bacteroidetes bacterium]|nr:hypothetical protein [Bacteroidota bacterium]